VNKKGEEEDCRSEEPKEKQSEYLLEHIYLP
jgi:hypothetical protein